MYYQCFGFNRIHIFNHGYHGTQITFNYYFQMVENLMSLNRHIGLMPGGRLT